MKEENGFDYDLYNDYRIIADSVFNSIPFYYEGTVTDWIFGQLSLIKQFNDIEDYEASKAIKYSAIEFVNKNLPSEERRIPLDAIINLEL